MKPWMTQLNLTQLPWSVPIAAADIPETGKRVEIAANAATREAVAKALGLLEVPRLDAVFELTRHGNGGAKVVAQISATVRQTCIVTLEPIENEIRETADLMFLPQPEAATATLDHGQMSLQADEPPEPLRDGQFDLGTIALEFLILGIDPYPRRPGARFKSPVSASDPTEHPFAGLEALKKQLAEKKR
jgi:uncharacterized metal-binding protein YceD (DUF177 family)